MKRGIAAISDRAVLILDIWNPYLSEPEREMVGRIYDAADRQRRAALGYSAAVLRAASAGTITSSPSPSSTRTA